MPKKAFYTYLDPNDPYKKYKTDDDNKFTAVLNDQPGNLILGEVAAYDKIIAEAKLMGYDFIELAQKRRHLDMPKFPNTDKIWHTWFYCKCDNLELWREMHPQASELLLAACQIICQKYPEYSHAVNVHLRSNLIFPHSMFAMSLDKFERYNNWLHSIFCRLELPPEPAKVGSLLAERLFTIWVLHNYGFKDHEFVTASAYDKVTGQKVECINGVCD